MDPTLPLLELAGAGIVTGLVQVAKTAGLQDRWAPLASVLLGLALGLFYVAAAAVTWPVGVLGGIVAGLTASGLYSGTRATLDSR